MTKLLDPLDLPVPRNQTVLMQHLQRLVSNEGYQTWCGGVIDRTKLPAFITKMAARYPIARNTSKRSQDRKKGLAVVHFVAYPVGDKVHWWLLSDKGKGGLADKASPDAHVARDAMAADGHITFGDYVLLYATKEERRRLPCPKTKGTRVFVKRMSTWTWKLRAEVVRELTRGIERCCEQLEYGSEGSNGKNAWGLRGLLASMRSRPLFSGVRFQVLQLHREAVKLWEPRQRLWCERHPEYVNQYGPSAGALLSIKEVSKTRLPKKVLMAVYADPPTTLRDLATNVADAVPAVAMET
ncbi:hypothetical protein [Burkholderia pseudomallei]|uniref:hypothetical protein n=1 Tax=Burkholderia pseudomallei TaxID=28450 RepID=UPI0027E054C4|nr:hypothetical protein [Burkholderia pseudomallei]